MNSKSFEVEIEMRYEPTNLTLVTLGEHHRLCGSHVILRTLELSSPDDFTDSCGKLR